MKAVKFVLAGGLAVAALVAAAPASAQYYPGYGYPAPGYGGGNVVGQVINEVFGGGYGGYGANGGYGNSQMAVGQCTSAVQARLARDFGYGYNPYGGYGAYGNAGGGARVLGVNRVEPRSNGLTVRGVASSGRYAGYNGGTVDLTWKCKVDYRGYISDIDIDRASRSNSYGYGNGYNSDPYNPYAQYGYRRY